jgi:5-methyltetrahydrofolate--homocysteine methyltransferase
MFALTTGRGVKEQAEILRSKGEYLKSFLLQILALELAEAFAEKIHEKMGSIWGITENPDLKLVDNKLKGKYQGIRVSPGYPICPQLEDQRKIFKLLRPEEVGIALTESLMMDPEASVTALVFSHPQAKVFKV